MANLVQMRSLVRSRDLHPSSGPSSSPSPAKTVSGSPPTQVNSVSPSVERSGPNVNRSSTISPEIVSPPIMSKVGTSSKISSENSPGAYSTGPGQYTIYDQQGNPTMYITLTDTTYTATLPGGGEGIGFPTVYNVDEEPDHYFEARAMLEKSLGLRDTTDSYETIENRRLQQMYIDSLNALRQANSDIDISSEKLLQLQADMRAAKQAWDDHRLGTAHTTTYDFGSYTYSPSGDGSPDSFTYSVTEQADPFKSGLQSASSYIETARAFSPKGVSSARSLLPSMKRSNKEGSSKGLTLSSLLPSNTKSVDIAVVGSSKYVPGTPSYDAAVAMARAKEDGVVHPFNWWAEQAEAKAAGYDSYSPVFDEYSPDTVS